MQPNRRGRPKIEEHQRQEINAALSYGPQAEPEERYRRNHGDSFGPPYGFAQVGSRYGQNRPGFFVRR
jgi:hypothetical protein